VNPVPILTRPLPAWIVFGTPLLFWLVLLLARGVTPDEEALRIAEGWRLVSDAAVPPQVEAAWEPVVLSDDWWRSLPHARMAWYRFELDLSDAPDRLWAIYLPRAAVNGAVWLNGEMIGSGGSMTPPIHLNWSRPLYLLIPNGLLRPGPNELQIELVSDLEGNGLLQPFYLGADQDLAPFYRVRYFLEVTAVEIISVFMITMSAFMGSLWWLRRDPVYGWFAVSIIFWALHQLPLLLTVPPLPATLWWWFWYATLGWAVIATVFFATRFLAIRQPLVERVVVILGLAGTLGLGIAAFQGGYWLRLLGNHGWDSLVLLVGGYATVLVLQAWRRQPIGEISWLLTSGLLIYSFGLHDWLLVNGIIPRDEGLFIQYSPPLVLLVFGWILQMRFVSALGEAESLNLELESRVEEQVAAVEAQHLQIRRLEREQLLAEERERLMRDMHDGLGGHLVSTLSLIEGAQPTLGEVKQALHQALDDLRLVVNSLDPYLDDLACALGDLRVRLEPRLRAAGIESRWRFSNLPSLERLGPERTLQILRVVQEAITNIIKHAAASQVIIAVAVENSRLELRVRDNGRGFEGMDGRGKGLASMHGRVQRIGGSLEISSEPGATELVLTLPLVTSS